MDQVKSKCGEGPIYLKTGEVFIEGCSSRKKQKSQRGTIRENNEKGGLATMDFMERVKLLIREEGLKFDQALREAERRFPEEWANYNREFAKRLTAACGEQIRLKEF